MLSYFFGNPLLSNQELLDLTLKHFYPWGTCEVEILFRITHDMLKTLNPDDSNFLEQFDKIVFGTMAMAFEIEERKYGNRKKYSAIQTLINLNNNEGTEKTILVIGEKIQTKEIILTVDQIERNFSNLIKYVPAIKNRLFALTNSTNPKAITEAENTSNSYLQWCNIL